MYQDLSSFKGHDFIVFLSKIEGKKEVNSSYVTIYSGYSVASQFVQDLDNGLNCFRCWLMALSLNYQKEDRKIYLISIFEHLEAIAEALKKFYSSLKKEYSFVCKTGEISAMENFPSCFSEEYHPTTIDYHNHKMHYMVNYHYETVVATIEALLNYSSKENINLQKEYRRINGSLTNSDGIGNDFLATILSSAQLALLFFLLADEILEQPFNKTHLAKFISNHFKTPRREHLKSFQIYKAFYEQNEHTFEVVKDIIFKIYQRLRSPKRD